jgi:SAM-dependent methyltransferase
MPCRLRCDDNHTGKGVVTLQANPHALPFASASMDLVILPHLLEFHDSPHQILREVERVLVPEGSVIVTGFNPFSFWGVRRRFTRTADAAAPWRGQYLSVHRLKDWFALLGLEPHRGSFGCYAPPFSLENRLQRWRFIELAGNRWWPYGGATYIIQAVKRVHGMRLIMPTWRERMARAKALALAQGKTQPQPSSRISTNRTNCTNRITENDIEGI